MSAPAGNLLTIGADIHGLAGAHYYYNGLGQLPTGDLRVTTTDAPVSVPEPTTLSLLGMGLAVSFLKPRRGARTTEDVRD